MSILFFEFILLFSSFNLYLFLLVWSFILYVLYYILFSSVHFGRGSSLIVCFFFYSLLLSSLLSNYSNYFFYICGIFLLLFVFIFYSFFFFNIFFSVMFYYIISSVNMYIFRPFEASAIFSYFWLLGQFSGTTFFLLFFSNLNDWYNFEYDAYSIEYDSTFSFFFFDALIVCLFFYSLLLGFSLYYHVLSTLFKKTFDSIGFVAPRTMHLSAVTLTFALHFTGITWEI